MKVAITEHQGRIAPVFDTCRRLKVFVQTDDGEVMISDEDWSSLGRHDRAARLKELGVEALVCGGISCRLEELIDLHGIKLMPWVAGDISEVLGALREGSISDPRYSMPGRGFGRRRRKMGRGRGMEMAHPRGSRKGVL
jgi:predicted Fe-Mo cluster-binding NifX family protein